MWGTWILPSVLIIVILLSCSKNLHIVNAHNASVLAASLMQGIKCLWNDGGKIVVLQYELLIVDAFLTHLELEIKLISTITLQKLCNILKCTFYTGTYVTPFFKNFSLKFCCFLQKHSKGANGHKLRWQNHVLKHVSFIICERHWRKKYSITFYLVRNAARCIQWGNNHTA